MVKNQIKIINKIAVFLVLLFIIIYILNFVYFKYNLEKKIVFRKEVQYKEFINLNNEIDYAFFGTSHSLQGINPKYIEKSFNFATLAENYIKTYYKLDKVLNKDNVEVNTVIFEVDLQTFSTILISETYLFNDLGLYSQYVPMEDIRKIRKDENIITLWIDSKFPVIGNGEGLGRIIFKPKIKEMYRGWVRENEDFSKSDMEKDAIDSFEEAFLNQERISNTLVEYFIKTLKLAHKNNLNIVFIKAPMSKQFDRIANEKFLEKEEYYSEIFKIINDTIGEDYHVLDYYDLFENESYSFQDATHLNYLGAENYSKEINSDLKKLDLPEKNKRINLKTNTQNIFDFKKSYPSKKNIKIILILISILNIEILIFLLIYSNLRHCPTTA